MNQDEIQSPVNLDEAFSTLYKLYGEKAKAIEELQTKIMGLEKEMEVIADPYDNIIGIVREKIEEEVKLRGSAFKCSCGKATYRKEYERVSWDTKALTGYAAAHPEIEQFKKISLVEAGVTISISLDGEGQ